MHCPLSFATISSRWGERVHSSETLGMCTSGGGGTNALRPKEFRRRGIRSRRGTIIHGAVWGVLGACRAQDQGEFLVDATSRLDRSGPQHQPCTQTKNTRGRVLTGFDDAPNVSRRRSASRASAGARHRQAGGSRVSAAPRRSRNPAGDGPEVLDVRFAEATAQCRLFVADHE